MARRSKLSFRDIKFPRLRVRREKRAPAAPPLPYGTSTQHLSPLGTLGISPDDGMPFGLGDLYRASVTGQGGQVRNYLQGWSGSSGTHNRGGIGGAIRASLDTFIVRKAFEQSYWENEKRSVEAAVQGTVVNPAMDFWGVYDQQGVREKTGMTFDFLRYFCGSVEPIAAIIGKRVNQAILYSRRAEIRRGQSTEPGFKIGLTRKKQKPTDADQDIINELEQFIEECGYCDPPEENRRIGWQPGFAHFLAELIRDRLTIDQIAVRRWASTDGSTPIACFACEDAGAIRKRRRIVRDIVNFQKVEEEYERDRTNTRQEIALVKVDGEGGAVVEEYTKDELFVAHGRPRTDVRANGYGYSEAEECFEFGTMFAAARDFNGLRFSKDALPRGVLVLMGNMTDQQVHSLQLQLKQTTQGLAKRWNIPIVRGMPQAGSSVQWLPFDMSPRDMEHQQTSYMAALIPHILYQISPDETGFSAASPFRPPLSEASPETNLKYSQDTGLRPLLRWVEDLINREIIWKKHPDRRYSFRFVGLGDYDALQDVQVRTARLQAGLSTPEEEWAEMDWTPPKEIADHPASKFPAPFAVGYQMLEQSMQAQQQTDMQQQQADQQNQQQQQAGDLQKFAAARQGYQQGQQGQQEQPGQPPGGSGGGTPVGTPPGIANPSSPVLKAIGWPFV